jgi:hypothetical protein
VRTRPRFLHLLRLFPILVMAAAPASAQQAIETTIPERYIKATGQNPWAKGGQR